MPLTDLPSAEEAARMTLRRGARADRQLDELRAPVAARPAEGRRFLEELAAAGGSGPQCGLSPAGRTCLGVTSPTSSPGTCPIPGRWCGNARSPTCRISRRTGSFPHLPALRESLRRARADSEAAVHLIWLFAQMNDRAARAGWSPDSETAPPEVVRFATGSVPEGPRREECRELADSLEGARRTLSPPFRRGFAGAVL